MTAVWLLNARSTSTHSEYTKGKNKNITDGETFPGGVREQENP